MTYNALGLVFLHSTPVFDDDGCTFVDEKEGTIFRKPNQTWKEAIKEARNRFEKLYELQVGYV